MPQLYESSGLLSLAALREHEKLQAQEQAEAARLRAEAEQRARLEAEREQARAERERRLAEEAAQRVAEAEQRAEQQRAESARRSELSRSEALARSTAELAEQLSVERASRRSVELRMTAELHRQRLFKSLASALCVASWLGAVLLYFGALRPRADLELGSAQRALLEEQRAHRDAEANNVRSTQRAEQLRAHVDGLEQELRDVRATRPLPLVNEGPRLHQPTPRPLIKAPHGPCGDDGDPLNPCLH